MKKLTTNGQKWLKIFHLFFVALWIGGAFSINLKQFFIHPETGDELYGILSTMDFIDWYVIVVGANGTLLTALLYSIFTKWGWFKHRWMTVKWIILLAGISFGTYPLGPWLSGMTELARTQGLGAFHNETFLHYQKMLMIFGSIQLCTILFAAIISVLKPWKNKVAAN